MQVEKTFNVLVMTDRDTIDVKSFDSLGEAEKYFDQIIEKYENEKRFTDIYIDLEKLIKVIDNGKEYTISDYLKRVTLESSNYKLLFFQFEEKLDECINEIFDIDYFNDDEPLNIFRPSKIEELEKIVKELKENVDKICEEAKQVKNLVCK